MDETLISAIVSSDPKYYMRDEDQDNFMPSDFSVAFENNLEENPSIARTKVKVTLRPWTLESLSMLHDFYNLIIFTAAQQAYADPILDKITELADKPDLFKMRLYRDSCLEVQG
jgi:TFIIF-interacting CTD phosphatase-like protein